MSSKNFISIQWQIRRIRKLAKKVKDPKAPKRHRSGYILFTIEKRPQVKLHNPGLSPKEIISELGALWKTADPQTKQHYQKLADAEKAEYRQKSNGSENEKEKKKENSNNNETIEPNQSMEVNPSQ